MILLKDETVAEITMIFKRHVLEEMTESLVLTFEHNVCKHPHSSGHKVNQCLPSDFRRQLSFWKTSWPQGLVNEPMAASRQSIHKILWTKDLKEDSWSSASLGEPSIHMGGGGHLLVTNRPSAALGRHRMVGQVSS